MKKKILLINAVYYSPVGHVIDGLKFAKGFYDKNKNLEISIIFNKNSPAELAKLCPWIHKFYTIDRREIGQKEKKATTYNKIPKNWDYIMENNQIVRDCDFREPKKDSAERDMFIHFKVSKEIFKAKISRGELYPKIKLPRGLNRKRDSRVRLTIPKKNIDFAKKYDYKGIKIGLMLGGSAGRALYPSINSWIKIIQGINKEYPNCKIYLTGVMKSYKGRTATQSYNEKDINILKRKFKNLVDCYDIGLFNQIALLKKMDVFISPHTGFAFLASCVDTPWLEIAGGDWSMYLWDHCPFYTVLPEDKKYPHMGGLENLKYKKSPKIPGMSDKELNKKIPEILKGLKLLIEKKINYKQSLKIYNEKVRKSNTNLKSLGKYPWHPY
jgi:ADP-heptose:LPS heptosyltransferase